MRDAYRLVRTLSAASSKRAAVSDEKQVLQWPDVGTGRVSPGPPLSIEEFVELARPVEGICHPPAASWSSGAVSLWAHGLQGLALVVSRVLLLGLPLQG